MYRGNVKNKCCTEVIFDILTLTLPTYQYYYYYCYCYLVPIGAIDRYRDYFNNIQ